MIKAVLGGLAVALLWGSAARGTEPPDELQPGAGQHLVVEVHARGFQVYVCTQEGGEYRWNLKGPDAQLFNADGAKVGKHFAGPTWEWNDRSQVTGTVVATVPSPAADTIPWLLLRASGHSGDGKLSHITAIQRLNTTGGKAPAAGCDAAHGGQETRVPYTADYRFYEDP